MNDSEAVELIREAVRGLRGPWADLGAGEGTFTRALAELLEPDSRIYAVDRDGRALGKLKRGASSAGREVITVVADFTQPFELPGLSEPILTATRASAFGGNLYVAVMEPR